MRDCSTSIVISTFTFLTILTPGSSHHPLSPELLQSLLPYSHPFPTTSLSAHSGHRDPLKMEVRSWHSPSAQNPIAISHPTHHKMQVPSVTSKVSPAQPLDLMPQSFLPCSLSFSHSAFLAVPPPTQWAHTLPQGLCSWPRILPPDTGLSPLIHSGLSSTTDHSILVSSGSMTVFFFPVYISSTKTQLDTLYVIDEYLSNVPCWQLSMGQSSGILTPDGCYQRPEEQQVHP